jgi:MFS family permease
MAVRYALGLALCFYINLSAGRVLLALYALHLGAQPFAVGVVTAMFYVFPVFLSWPVGALSDRLGARWLLLFAALCGALGLLIPYFVASMPALYTASALCGLSLAFYNVILQNLMGILGTAQQRTRNFANLSLAGSISNAIGPLFAGYAVDQCGHALASLWMMVPVVLAAVLLLTHGALLPGRSKPAPRNAKLLATLADPDIWRMLGASALVQLGMDLFQFYIPIYGHSLNLSNSAIGLALSSFALAMFVIRMVLPRMVEQLTEQRLLAYSFYVSGAGYLLLAFSESAPALALVAFVFGLGIGCATPLTMILMFSRSAEGRSGEALGLRLTTNNVVRVLGPTVFGLIGSVFGLIPVFYLSALVIGAGGLLSRPARPVEGGPGRSP